MLSGQVSQGDAIPPRVLCPQIAFLALPKPQGVHYSAAPQTEERLKAKGLLTNLPNPDMTAAAPQEWLFMTHTHPRAPLHIDRSIMVSSGREHFLPALCCVAL